MKKLLPILIVAFLLPGLLPAQETTAHAQQKINQRDLLNEVYATYGFGSLYMYIAQNQKSSWSYTTPGTFVVGYTRSINKIIGVGFLLGYTPLNGEYQNGPGQSEHHNYIQALARIRFQYLNNPSFGMYSGIAIGVTQDFYSTTYSGMTSNKQQLLPAGQLTLLGFRVGRTGAFCGEFGLGTLAILNLGVSIKFGQ